MNTIDKSELKEIVGSYGIKDPTFDTPKWVEPDTTIYPLRDENDTTYVLLAADFLSGYEELKMPYEFEFNEGYPYAEADFTAVKVLSYLKNSPKSADSCMDDKHIFTSAKSTGDTCMLFEVTYPNQTLRRSDHNEP